MSAVGCEGERIPYEAVAHIGEGPALVLAPHADDEVFGCAGAILQHVAASDPVTVIILTDGAGFCAADDPERAAYIARRRDESRAAAAILGYGQPIFWEYGDRALINDTALVNRLCEAVRAAQARWMYAPSPHELHPDHVQLAQAARAVMERLAGAVSLAFYEIGAPLQPNRLLDISHLCARKQQAMRCFTSQLVYQDYDRHVAALNTYRTYTLPRTVTAAEAYHVITANAATLLTISIVTYAPDIALLTQVLAHLKVALLHAYARGVLTAAHVVIVDNGPGNTWQSLLQDAMTAVALPATTEVRSGHGNIGYGAGHNLTVQHPHMYHLILNPDVLMAEDALTEGLTFFAAHPHAGLITPFAVDGNEQRQYLCKRYPTVWDLALRGFAPQWVQQWFVRRLHRYELRDETRGDAPFWNPPMVSGCFMLCRRAPLTAINGFCPDYFLYFEDFDLSVRLATVTQLVFVPTVRITHFGGHTARKGWRHIALFLRSAAVFFRKKRPRSIIGQ